MGGGDTSFVIEGIKGRTTTVVLTPFIKNDHSTKYVSSGVISLFPERSKYKFSLESIWQQRYTQCGTYVALYILELV